jgi:cell division septation protein DedD
VQAGAYAQIDRAQGVIASAKARGVSCLISPAETSKGTLYRVRCGGYADQTQAAAAVARLSAAQIPSKVVAPGE